MTTFESMHESRVVGKLCAVDPALRGSFIYLYNFA
jgi:hypothetical protein